MEEPLEQVDGLGGGLRDHLLEGDLRVAWVLLLRGLVTIRFLDGDERDADTVVEKGYSPTR